MLKEAMFYEKLENNAVRCRLCPHNCYIPEGRYGVCGVRKNVGGRLFSENYGVITSIALDPIEKKPLYHFYPGSYIFSVGTYGCNLKCKFCQNWEIAHQKWEGDFISPQDLILHAKRQRHNIGIAFTYNEPLIWYEYVYEGLQEAKKQGLKTVLVTNGYINPEPLKNLLPYVDAMNIDVKAFTEDFYKKIVGGRLDPVLKTVEEASKHSHVEITNLIVTDLNDSEEEIRNLSKWLFQIDKNIPLHFSRYFPQYKLANPPTPISTLERARDIAKEYLNFVYIGNVLGIDSNTYCPHCGNLLIERHGFYAKIKGPDGNRCSKCGSVINVVV
ncbi:radical SAM protein [Caldanaerobacter subterraneus subsp. yonseiensis KB-1]|uniref:Radical SAM protein n=1 Tax=Caldanaerobacter subterraneus subsp. yonseiensis KB-1 TaxID=1388761 RepID=U5CES6_CALSX|nr:AmmeMemoRadiSam system radical SAM enzyme [Caldanaerobacter subterraneus]ERM91400.1 radical SAM protein [Caldanaerobacter subterraneus subsp. yonseiensis KB-1]